MSPITKEVIETERLRLIRISDTSLTGDHLKWFHANWVDPVATSWRYTLPLPHAAQADVRSLHGKCKTLEESQAWFTEHLERYDTITYIVFSRFNAEGEELEYPGEVLGNVGLRTQAKGAELPPFPRDTAAPTSDQTPTDPSTPPLSSLDIHKPFNLRSLGYSFLQIAWGKGYATEAGRAVIDAYREGTKEAREKGEVYYVEAIWSPENVASGKVLGKLGFRTIGYKEEERVWLAGDWRYGYNVSGLYV
ncbi:hypothetical protein SLS60_001016 [Paraconiothyrium brasiliense]|uniref:N-acetyltransferase domain-containing protein n=1 Tax=Paraconiothyrium brasiliense TaxID=300254 RepID=A0ABR3S828_9PLEO